jgi:hypothetical protein
MSSPRWQPPLLPCRLLDAAAETSLEEILDADFPSKIVDAAQLKVSESPLKGQACRGCRCSKAEGVGKGKGGSRHVGGVFYVLTNVRYLYELVKGVSGGKGGPLKAEGVGGDACQGGGVL